MMQNPRGRCKLLSPWVSALKQRSAWITQRIWTMSFWKHRFCWWIIGGCAHRKDKHVMSGMKKRKQSHFRPHFLRRAALPKIARNSPASTWQGGTGNIWLWDEPNHSAKPIKPFSLGSGPCYYVWSPHLCQHWVCNMSHIQKTWHI